MNPSTKVFSILSLASAIGGILGKIQDEKIAWRGQKLHEAGFEATQKYPFPQLNNSKVRQIKKKVEQICQADTDFEIVETLSFLLCGLDDILIKTNPRNAEFINPVISRVLWCQELFNPKLNTPEIYAAAVGKYEIWAA